MPNHNFKGIIPAVITPLKENREIDTDAFDDYLKWIVPQRVVGLAVNVDTGEGPTLTPEERSKLLRLARERLGNSRVLVAGLTAGSTETAKKEARMAADAGADVMLVFPNMGFRGKPQNSIAIKGYHFEITKAADIDLMLFQLQDALGGIELEEDSLRALASLKRVVAIKEATFDFSKFKRTMALFREIVSETGSEIAFLTGNDNFVLESFLWGCDGALIGAGAQDTLNLVRCFEACSGGDWEMAVNLAKRFQPLIDTVFSPPVRDYRARTKACLYLQGVIPNRVVRPPLVEVAESELEDLRRALRAAGLEVVN